MLGACQWSKDLKGKGLRSSVILSAAKDLYAHDDNQLPILIVKTSSSRPSQLSSPHERSTHSSHDHHCHRHHPNRLCPLPLSASHAAPALVLAGPHPPGSAHPARRSSRHRHLPARPPPRRLRHHWPVLARWFPVPARRSRPAQRL